jgi:predicted amidohydrolase
MRVILVQLAIDNLNPEGNRERAAQLVRDTHVLDPIPPHSLIVLPELFSTGTLSIDFKAADAVAIAETDRAFLVTLARETACYVLAGILGPHTLSGESAKPYNLALLFDPAGLETLSYGKVHPFSLGGEDKIFTGGTVSEDSDRYAVPTASVEGFTLQAAVCYDLRFPELFRAGSQRGVDLIVLPANWPESRRAHWDVLLRARAIENQCFVAGVNCVGVQRGTRYAGGSCIVSPKGEVLAAGGEEEGVVTADIAADHVKNWRRVFPALRDRKPPEFWNGTAG